jgi:GT2 family glycosyltransferase
MEKYLEQCLETIVEQTIFEQVEIICVNDGSKDASMEILQRYGKKYNNFVVIDQENAGVGIARNNGIMKATGQFVAFMDPDDYYLENDTLEILYSKAIENDVLICGGSLSEDHNDGKWIRKDFLGIYTKYTFVEEKLIEYKDYQFDFGFYRFIYKRDFLLENEIFFPPLIRFQDPPFFVKAMIKAGRFYAVPNYTYCYRYGHQNLVWREERICALIQGHIEDLKLSADAGLGELHALTLYRLVSISKDVIAKGLADGSLKVMELLLQAENFVNQQILPTDSEVKSVYQVFFDYYREAEACKVQKNELVEKCKNLEKEEKRLKKRVKELENSTTYKVGKKMLFVPQKIKKIIKK